MKVYIFIGATLAWEIERPEVDDFRGFRVHSRAKICPWCLKIWARMLAGTPPYGVEMQSCEDCNGKDGENIVPGSLLDDRVSWTLDLDLLKYLPPELIEREYKLHMRHYEQSTANSPSSPRTLAPPGS